mmetsp:Transcript_807/g.1654  ORF Transcript_807/g.1654 Transcript_807/m.1654 type:complete len:202 (+) Transcript_807:181-786(+)
MRTIDARHCPIHHCGHDDDDSHYNWFLLLRRLANPRRLGRCGRVDCACPWQWSVQPCVPNHDARVQFASIGARPCVRWATRRWSFPWFVLLLLLCRRLRLVDTRPDNKHNRHPIPQNYTFVYWVVPVLVSNQHGRLPWPRPRCVPCIVLFLRTRARWTKCRLRTHEYSRNTRCEWCQSVHNDGDGVARGLLWMLLYRSSWR